MVREMRLFNHQSKYYQIYRDFLKDRAESEEVTLGVDYECHHIIPKCLGGKHKSYNIIFLTPREHEFAYRLLIRAVNSEEHKVLLKRSLEELIHRNNPSPLGNLEGYADLPKDVEWIEKVNKNPETNAKRSKTLKGTQKSKKHKAAMRKAAKARWKKYRATQRELKRKAKETL